MMKATSIYDFLSSHKATRRISIAVITAVLLGLTLTLHFSEDITDFLPLGTEERENMDLYQEISGAEKIFILFSNNGDEVMTEEAMDLFEATVHEDDSNLWCESLKCRFDMDDIRKVSTFVYEHIPYFLTEGDYERMDSIIAIPGIVAKRLEEDRNALLFPTSSFVSEAISHDPLGLFSPALKRLSSSSGNIGFEMRDGYIFTPDTGRAVAMMQSPFGSSETEHNSLLVKLLEEASEKVRGSYPEVDIDIIGGPVIAVGNSSRIKKDSIIAISLSAVFIVMLLIYAFRSLRNILLIFLSVGWGLLFALGGMALFSDRVSIIVIGISSVILGIAVNYPLHLIAHSYHERDTRRCLSEIISPLVVGNITTVGAFLALVPLKSSALADLGLFASLLLVGTILFVIIYLPHYIKGEAPEEQRRGLFEKAGTFSPERHSPVVILTGIITVFLAYYSTRTEFDSNMSHINYMTKQQRADMQYFEDLLTRDSTHTARTLYVYGRGDTFDEALSDIGRLKCTIDSLENENLATAQNEVLSFLRDKSEQFGRLERWREFTSKHKDILCTSLAEEAVKEGFSEAAFSRFFKVVAEADNLEPKEIGWFEPLTRTIFTQNTAQTGKSYIVCNLNVEPRDMEQVRGALEGHCFDVESMNDAMTGSLSDNFNYIGWACSLIVFFFLWFSFGRLELALTAFLPMAVSWLWILGLMALLDIKFNIVNIILATFIFGQGDDYTIFMTEGCQYEYARRRPILASYKSSILESAAIMFVGIGTLIVARHPAMRSLAEVTIIGMSSVVFMAYLIPPLLFHSLTSGRKYPLTIRRLFCGRPKDLPSIVYGRYIYKGKEIERSVRKNMKSDGEHLMGLALPEHYIYNDEGYGEKALLMALSHPLTTIEVHIADQDRRQIAFVAANGLATNIKFDI